MSINIPVSAVTLNYVCINAYCEHEGKLTQPLADITDAGTLICPECGEDMGLSSADLTGEPRQPVVIDEESVDALSPRSDQPGVLVVDAVAIGHGTHAAVFRPVERRFNTPTLDFHRSQTGVEFIPSY